MNDICQICGRKLVHAPAFTDGTPTFVGYFPCVCSRDVYLKRRLEVLCKTYRKYLEDHLGITDYNIIYKMLFDCITDYCSDITKIPIILITIEEHMYRSVFVVDKEITLSTCLLKILEHLKK